MCSDRASLNSYADLIRKCFPSRLRCLPLREANAPVALRASARGKPHSRHPHTQIHTRPHHLIILIASLPPTSSISTLDQGRREDNSDLSSPTSWTHQGEGERRGRKVEIQRDERWERIRRFKHRLYVQPPVLHIDKHMSIGRSMGFVDEQTRLYIVQAVGQWTTGHPHHHCCLLQIRKSSTRSKLAFMLSILFY